MLADRYSDFIAVMVCLLYDIDVMYGVLELVIEVGCSTSSSHPYFHPLQDRYFSYFIDGLKIE